jgi:hypothetical protein
MGWVAAGNFRRASKPVAVPAGCQKIKSAFQLQSGANDLRLPGQTGEERTWRQSACRYWSAKRSVDYQDQVTQEECN